MNNIKVKEIVARGYINPSKLPGYDYVINPYVGCPHRCMYCYAEFMKRFSNHSEPWGTFTDVKIRSTSVRSVAIEGKSIFFSSVTDCYNPLEERYRLTRHLLEQLVESGTKVTILTKSALVTRDIDIFKRFTDITVGISLNTENLALSRETEPFASTPMERLYALKTLHENGIHTWMHVAPIFPYLTEWKSLLETAAPFTDTFSFENLKLRAAALPRILLYITQRYPHLQEVYNRIYRQDDMEYWRMLRKEILAFCNQKSLAASIHFAEKSFQLEDPF